MKLKKLLSLLLTAAVFLTSLALGGVTASAAAGISVSGEYKDGYYVLQMYGMSKKQYNAFINGADGFRVTVYSADGKSNVFASLDTLKKTAETPVKGYKGGYRVYCGILGNKISSYSTFSDITSVEGLYGSAPGKSYGFRWKLDAGDKNVRSFLPAFTKDPNFTVAFEDVSHNPVKPAGLKSRYSVRADLGDAPLELTRSGSTAQLTIAPENYYKYANTKGAVMDITLKCSGYTISTAFSGGTNYTSTADLNGSDFISKVSVKGKLTEHGGITLTYTFSDKTAAKAFSTSEITARYRVTSGGKIISGGNGFVTVARSGKGNIKQMNISSVETQIYTGKALTPALVIRDGYTKLTAGTDYTLTYKNNTKVGTASVTIKGKGNYTGSKTVKFRIIPGSTSLSERVNDKGRVISWRRVTGAEMYQLYRLEDGKFVSWQTPDGSAYSVTIPAEETGSFKIRALIKSGSKYTPGAWSEILTID